MQTSWVVAVGIALVTSIATPPGDTVSVAPGRGLTTLVAEGARSEAVCAQGETSFIDRDKAVFNVGVLVPNSTCVSLVAAFSAGQGAWVQFSPWTAGVDSLTASPKTISEVPMVVRVFGPPNRESRLAGIVRASFDRANTVYDAMRVGIRFTSSSPVFLSPALTETCEELPQVLAAHPDWYTPNALNVYFLSIRTIENGYLCPSGDIILINNDGATGETLGHELGHFLWLAHSPDPTNIMASGSHTGRSTLTIQQAFLANAAAASKRGEGWPGCSTPGDLGCLHDGGTSKTVGTAVKRWMECEECSDGEFQAVIRLARDGLDALRPFLTSSAVRPLGPFLERSASEIGNAVRKKAPGAWSSQQAKDYVSAFEEQTLVRYRLRAARVAASEIPNPGARELFDAIVNMTTDPDLKERLKSMLAGSR